MYERNLFNGEVSSNWTQILRVFPSRKSNHFPLLSIAS